MSTEKKSPAKTFETALAYCRSNQFDVESTQGVANQVQVRKYGCGAVLARKPDGGVTYAVLPGCLVGGEIAKLVDRGYQKFLQTSRFEVAATADRLHALHAFEEELWEAVGAIDYYNLALGTVSDLYLYDRLKGREPETKTASETH